MVFKKDNEEFPIIELPKKQFPKKLLEIPQLPKKLFIRGELPPVDYIHLCVVGARKYSPYGKEVCEMLIAGLRGRPVVIVSGQPLLRDRPTTTATGSGPSRASVGLPCRCSRKPG